MNTTLVKERIKARVSEVEEEWILLSIQRLLGMSDSDEANLIGNYERDLQPMTTQEVINRALQSEKDILLGRVTDIEDLLIQE
jgi:hypothetical protein